MDQSGTPPPETLPKWLTEDYFRSLFRRKSPGEEVTVQNVTVNFADEERIHGRLIRAAVDVATPAGPQTLSYIVKRPGPGQFSTTRANANMYRMESLVLGVVIPAMEKVLDAVAPGKFGQLAPRLVDYGLDENRFIMTEDLSVQDFSTGDRRVGLDLEHSLAYVQHLAAFHAASVAVMNRYESELNAIPRLTDSEEVKFLNEYIATSVKGVVSVIDSWDDGSEFADRVRTLGATLPARLAHANRAQSEVLNVLCHGDMFVNNILFRRAGGRVDVRLVDFELARVGSFAGDLAGFVASAVSDEVMRHHWEHVTEAYREALNAGLGALGHGARAVSREALRQELRAQQAVAQFALFHMLPHTRAPAAVDLAAGGEAFTAPAFHGLLRLLLPRFRALGWLDESKGTTNNVGVPSWLNHNYFQSLLLRQSPGANLRVQRVHVTKSEGQPTSTTAVFHAAVKILFPSGVVTKFFRVRCPGDGVLYKMPAATCMLEMEALLLGKAIPVAEEIATGTKSDKVDPSPATEKLASSSVNGDYSFSSNIHRNAGYRSTPNHKSADLKFCLAILRHLVLLQVASMIAFERDNCSISENSKLPPSSVNQECVKVKSVTKPSATGQKDISNTEKQQKLRSEVPHQLFQSDQGETTGKHTCHEKKQIRQEKEIFEVNDVDFQYKTVFIVNSNNRLILSSEAQNISDSITEQPEKYFTTFTTKPHVMDYCDQEPSHSRLIDNLESKVISDNITEQSTSTASTSLTTSFNLTSHVIRYGDQEPSDSDLLRLLDSQFSVDHQQECLSHVNLNSKIIDNSERQIISDSITENLAFTERNTTSRVLECVQEPSENLRQLACQYPVDWIALPHLSPHATSSTEVDLRSGRHSLLTQAIKPSHSVHCRLTERFLPRLEITRCVHI